MLLLRTRQCRGRLARDRIVPGGLDAALGATRTSVELLAPWKDAGDAVRRDDNLRSAVLRRAASARERTLELFGDESVHVGIPPRWSTDPRHGRTWPLAYHRSIDYVNLGSGSDVKRVWELSRLRHLVQLAQAVAVAGDDAALGALEDDLRDWHSANPLGWSVNWTSAMEVALRAVNLICVDGILVSSRGAYSTRPLLVSSLYQHGWFLSRNLEISDVNGNHFLANGVGLVWLGRYFGAIGEAPRWLERGREMVLEGAREQVLADGVDHEGSLPYHLLVLEMFLLARVAAGSELEGLDATIAAMVDATLALVRPDGLMPDLGDDDGGRVAAFSDAPSRDARRLLALAGALLEHSQADRVAGRAYPEDALWLLGPRALERSVAAPSGEAVDRQRWFPEAGLAVLGDGGDHVVVNLGPIGFRGRGGHGHVDAMSFEAVLGGIDAVRDSGTGSYTGDPVLRNELRDAYAHTLIVIDDRPYARIGGHDRLWSIAGDARPSLLRLDVSGEEHLLVAVQDVRLGATSARYERRLEWRAGRLAWSDTVDAPAGVPIVSLLQLPDGCELVDGQIQSARFSYVWTGPPGAEITLMPYRRSDRYGSVRPGLRAAVRWVSRGAPSALCWRIERR